MTLIDTLPRASNARGPALAPGDPQAAATTPSTGVIVLPPPAPRIPGLAGVLRFDPLAPLTAILPFIMIVGTSLSWHPGAFVLCLVSPLLVLAQPRRGLRTLLALLLFTGLLTIGCAGAPTTMRVHDSAEVFSAWPLFTPEHWNSAFDVSARIGAILSLILLAGLLSDPADTIRAFVLHLRMPSRIGQAGIAALGFTGFLRREHRAILESHILRGSDVTTPLLGSALRWLKSAPALVAAAIRRAERMSMSMDARGFGAYPTRTETSVFSWRLRDSLLIICSFAAALVLIRLTGDSGFALTPVRS